MKDETNPAFPHNVYDYDSCGEMKVRYTESGMSLRDYIAIKCLAGYSSLPDFYAMGSQALAMMAYDQADAMILLRNK